MKTLHIISFDVPFPANYGGVIDVFYKLKALHALGVDITLHCFEYGRAEAEELKKYCNKVYYYKRNNSVFNQLSSTPFIVKSRTSEQLVQNLLLDKAPILFEGLHTCAILNDKRLKNRFKIYRESNIEHEYYRYLASSEKNIFKKWYFKLEANKLEKFENELVNANAMLVVSEEDTRYLQKKFPDINVKYLPSFHPYNTIECTTGKGNFALYHGNLSISENYLAAEYLIKEVFSKTSHKLIIAGLNPKDSLLQLAKHYENVEIIANPSDEKLNELLKTAHINCLYTHQESGLKLKLLNSLFAGRFCLVNDKMLYGTSLQNCCEIANTSEEFIEKTNSLFATEFSSEELEKRAESLEKFNIEANAKQIIELILTNGYLTFN